MSEKKKAEEKEKELTMEIQKVKDTVIRLEKVSYSMDWKHLKFSRSVLLSVWSIQPSPKNPVQKLCKKKKHKREKETEQKQTEDLNNKSEKGNGTNTEGSSVGDRRL